MIYNVCNTLHLQGGLFCCYTKYIEYVYNTIYKKSELPLQVCYVQPQMTTDFYSSQDFLNWSNVRRPLITKSIFKYFLWRTRL